MTPTPPSRALSRRVLIVEDERRLREMLHAAATEAGFEPVAVPSAEAALKQVDREPFAVALLDLNLPGMGGLDLCDHLHRQTPATQVVILTGFGDLDAARRAIRLEVVDFLIKPCGMDDLEQALNRAKTRWLDRLVFDDLPPAEPPAAEPDPPPPQPSAVDEPVAGRVMDVVEREAIFAALDRHRGNRTAAAADLGISVRKLYYRLRQYHRGGHAWPGPPR